MVVRIWNILLLEALQKSSLKNVASQLFAHLPSFSVAYHTSLRGHINPLGISQELFSFDINQAYIAIKLWLLLSVRASETQFDEHGLHITSENQVTEDRNASSVWNELWPAFENLIVISEVDAEMSDVTVCRI